MYLQNLTFGHNVWVDPTASLNNVRIGDDVIIGMMCTIFGSENNPLTIGDHSRIGTYTILNGYSAPLAIGSHTSIGPWCHFLVDSGPTKSPRLLVKYPLARAPISVGNHCHIGAGTMLIMGASVGDCSIIEPNSFVNGPVPPYSIFGGTPAKLVRKIKAEET